MPGGACPDRTLGQRENDALRSGVGYDDPAEADQSKGAFGRGPRFLWAEPTLAVHGSDQSAGGADPQAASFRAGTWRSFTGSGRV